MIKIPVPATDAISDPKPALDETSGVDTALIAEDDAIFRRILESCFKKWDYRVTSVDNGLAAWEVLQQANAPQLAILDWMMPGMEGIELCRRIRSHNQGPYRYILLLTAKDDQQDVVQGLEAGADDYLTKPFDVDELRARVRAGKRILDLQAALIRAKDDLQFAAAHDPLTGLWNRGAIIDFLLREVSRCRRSAEPLGVVMADIDHFKKINDTYGHPIGDVVLQEVSRRLGLGVRTYDVVGRYGGEEFLIILPGCTGSNLRALVERLRAAIADQPVETSAGKIPVTLSLGLSSAEQGEKKGLDWEALLRSADQALYSAKGLGRNRVESAAIDPPPAAGLA